MNLVLFLSQYLMWHYTLAYRDIAATYLNFTWFIAHFFSMPILLRTLFSPWKRINTGHRKFDFEDWATSIVFNIMSRIVGAIVRSIFLVIGTTLLGLLTVFFLCFLLLWCLLPVLVWYMLYYGIMLLLV